MPDYTKLKNAELEALLKERGLPHTGKKADMVSRLTDDDSKKAAATGPPATENEDEIDWDDDAPEAPVAPSSITKPAEAEATTTSAEGNNPQAVPNQAAAIDPSTTDDLATEPPTAGANGATKSNGSESAPAKKEVDFTTGLEKTDIEKEIEKRKVRAARFGIKTDEENPAAAEALKALNRAKKFGTEGVPAEAAQVKSLDQALPDRREKRRHDGGEDRGDYKRGSRGGFRRGGRDNRGPRGQRDDRRSREPRQERTGGGDRGTWMSEEDRRRADARAARFA